MSEQYKILISVSHHRIAVGYWLRDGGGGVVAMPGGDWPAALAFYCTDTRVVIGDEAVRAIQVNTQNAFGGYFSLLGKGVSYTRIGQTRDIRYILLDACECLFGSFFKEVMFDRVGNLDNNRATMPLSFICESDIKPNERALLKNLFSSSGYNCVNVVEYDDYLDRYVKQTMRGNYDCDNVVVAWTEGDDLTFTLFDMKGLAAVKMELCEGLGVDPRIAFVEEKLWECLLSQNPFLNRDNEKAAIEKAATEFLNSSLPMVNAELKLSDGIAYRYNLDKNSFDFMPHGEGATAKDKMLAFLQNNGVVDRGRTLLLLRGAAAENSYFEESLSSGFFKTLKSTQSMREGVMRLIVNDKISSEACIEVPSSEPKPAPQPASSDISEFKKKWRQDVRPYARGKVAEGKAEEAKRMLVDFLAELTSAQGPEPIRKEVEAEISKIPVEDPKPKTEPSPEKPAAPSDLTRRWREVKASAKALCRSGKIREALAMLQKFVDEAKRYAGTDDLVAMAEAVMSEINAPAAKPAPSAKPVPKPVATPKPEKVKVAPALIDPNKLKEVRDQLQAQGDDKKAQLLTKIIRAKKSADVRKGEIDSCRKAKNKEQVRRIVDELNDFVKLCNQAGVDTVDYVKLINDYKRI